MNKIDICQTKAMPFEIPVNRTTLVKENSMSQKQMRQTYRNELK